MAEEITFIGGRAGAGNAAADGGSG